MRFLAALSLGLLSIISFSSAHAATPQYNISVECSALVSGESIQATLPLRTGTDMWGWPDPTLCFRASAPSTEWCEPKIIGSIGKRRILVDVRVGSITQEEQSKEDCEEPPVLVSVERFNLQLLDDATYRVAAGVGLPPGVTDRGGYNGIIYDSGLKPGGGVHCLMYIQTSY